jgi:hypothetical protein
MSAPVSHGALTKRPVWVHAQTKLKLNLKLAIQRLQMLQKKKGLQTCVLRLAAQDHSCLRAENLCAQDRKRIAEDLERGKTELARVRVRVTREYMY